MDKPELIIPVRFDTGKIPRALKEVGDGGKKAGADVEEGMKKAKASADTFTDSLGGIMKAQIVLGAAKQAAMAIGDQYRQTAQYVAGMAKEFQGLRQAMQQVAALKGEQNTTKFTLAEARMANKGLMTPEAWRGFQEQFQSYGGAYLEGDQARFIDRGGVSAKEQAEKYQLQVAEFTQARGLSSADTGQLAGGLLQFSQGPQKTEDLMSRFGKVFKTLERAPTPVAQLLPQMTRVMAQGASPEEAAQLLGIMSEAMPGEEETGVTNTIKAITNQILEGKGEALGQKEGMSRLEQVKAAVAAIKGRVDRGEKLDAVLHEIAPDLREMRGVKGFLTRGLEAGGFERTAGYIADTAPDFVEKELRAYESGGPESEGGTAKIRARKALAGVELGARNEGINRIRDIAEIELMEGGGFERVNKGAVAAATIPGADSARDIQINQQAIRRARAMLGEGAGFGDTTAAVHRGLTDELLRELAERLKSIDEGTKVANLQRADGIARDATEAQPPLHAPPPQPAGRQ